MEDQKHLCAPNNSPTKTQTSEEEATKNVRCCGMVCCWKKKSPMGAQITAEHTDRQEELEIIYNHELDQPLQLEHCIEIYGTPHSSWRRYAVDFKCTNASGGDIALHFNPRHDMRVIVRNSREGGSWKTEETIIPPGFQFPRDKSYSLIFFFTPKCFMIAINDIHFCTFQYRIPLQKIRFIEINGETAVHSVNYREMYHYPKPSEDMCHMKIPTMDNFQENKLLPNPFIGHLGKGLPLASQLEIHGKVHMLPESFSVNLQEGAQVYPSPIIPLRLNARFSLTISSNAVIRNAYIKGGWGQEEISSGFSFQPGQLFILIIQLEVDRFVMWMNKKLLGEFRYRIPPTGINTAYIEGDIDLYKVFIRPKMTRIAAL